VTTSAVHLRTAVPVVPVTDATDAIAFYRDRLGFTVAFEQGEYAGVTRDGVELHLDGVVNAGAGKVTCRIETVGVDDLFAELEPSSIIDPAEPLHTMPWGARQFSVRDCCGNRITFVSSA
jgi:uncharacterized glyoxalase superfamily protein PhnB